MRGRLPREVWIVGGVFLAFAAIGLILSLWDGPFDPTKVGTLGEWAAAVGTVGAVMTALWGASHERQTIEDERQHLLSEQQLEMANGVVLHSETRELEAEGQSICFVWVNVFSPDPLRRVQLRVRWSEGSALPAKGRGPAYHEVKVDPENSRVGQWVFSHIDPGAAGWERRFICDAAGAQVSVEMRWFDRWNDEWLIRPGRAPRRVHRQDYRPLP